MCSSHHLATPRIKQMAGRQLPISDRNQRWFNAGADVEVHIAAREEAAPLLRLGEIGGIAWNFVDQLSFSADIRVGAQKSLRVRVLGAV
jgi:hypothetical protein